MIVRPNGGYEENALFPSSNWYTNEPDNYVIDETTESGRALADKIKANYPFYNLVIQNDRLVDVTPRDPEPGEVPEPEPPQKTEEQMKIEQLEGKVYALEQQNALLTATLGDFMLGGM